MSRLHCMEQPDATHVKPVLPPPVASTPLTPSSPTPPAPASAVPSSIPTPLSPTSTAATSSQTAATYFGQFDSQCESVLRQSLVEPYLSKIAASHQFAAEMALWQSLIGNKREVELFQVAEHEYEYSLLALAQGHYRHAFKSLRLVLELSLQAVYLSSNEIKLREWLASRLDSSWSAIIDNKEGVFSERFCKAFFPDLKDHTAHHGGMAVLLYRECSECVHGNVQVHIPLPDTIVFEPTTFNLWHSKADILKRVVNFELALRYLNDLSADDRLQLASTLSLFSHIAAIQKVLTPQGTP